MCADTVCSFLCMQAKKQSCRVDTSDKKFVGYSQQGAREWFQVRRMRSRSGHATISKYCSSDDAQIAECVCACLCHPHCRSSAQLLI